MLVILNDPILPINQLLFNIPADILRTGDDLSQVLERYEALARSTRPSKSSATASSTQHQSAALDLLDLGPLVSQSSTLPPNALDEQLLSLGSNCYLSLIYD